MKRLLPFVAAAMLLSGLVCVLRAQTPAFDLNAYRAYLAQHGGIDGGGVLREHPAPVFQRRAQIPFTEARYLDSARLKYKLTADEMDLLSDHGFLVTERLSYGSFGTAYQDAWVKDMPVLVSTDAILHAVHMSYDEILKATEVQLLIPRLDLLLRTLHTSSLLSLNAAHGSNPGMRLMLRDLDLYLTVARRLLNPSNPPDPLYADNKASVNDMLLLIAAEQPSDLPLFSSTNRTLDFSQFTVRGHYADDPALAAYFKAMIWLGRTEFMLTKPVQQGVPEQKDEDIQRQVIDAYLVKDAVAMADSAGGALEDIDGMITFLVGESDNVTTKNLAEVQRMAGFTSPDQLLDKAVFDGFTKALAGTPFAEQRINSQILMSDPSDPEQLKPPSAFLLLGQRFIVDSYVFGNVVFDRILKDGRKVMRMLPLPMDALFAIGNDASAQLMQEEMQRWSYAPNLSALRYLIDSYGDDFWNASLYNTWLHAIRALNPPDVLEQYPAFMQTAAWWQEKMNTQLASWAQLRHDNLLYAKQSYTGGAGCSFPEGYVEPYPEMYARLADFARGAETKYRSLKLNGIARFFAGMSTTMDTLRVISNKELTGTPLSQQEVSFIQHMLYTVSQGCVVGFGGWYQGLFFNREITETNYVVADVHTAPTDAAGNPVGWVLHVGTGKVNLGFAIAPSQQGGLIVYTGPMLSYFEHVTTNFKRMTDKEWAESLRPSIPYPRPDWVNSYLADNNGNRRQAGPALITAIEELPVTAPSSASASMLHPVYPNPITSSSAGMISFTVTETAPTPVTLDVYDMVGRRVRSVVKATVTKGTFVARWDGTDDRGNALPAGSYVVRFSNGVSVSSRMVALAR